MKNNNITAQLVKEHIFKNPFLLNYLSRNLINVTNLAREILSTIQKQNPKATIESIAIAIHRLQIPSQEITKQLQTILSNVQITMRTNISLFCLRKGSSLFDIKTVSHDDIFYVNYGADEITVILDQKNEKMIKEHIVLHKKNLALITLKDTLTSEKINYRITPGFVHAFLSNISKEGINIEDIISTYSQVTFVVEEKYLSQVFAICVKVKELQL